MDPGFQVRGGTLKKIAPSEHFWGISCEKSRFYAKKSYFFPILGGPPPPGSAPEIYIRVEMQSYKITDSRFPVLLSKQNKN